MFKYFGGSFIFAAAALIGLYLFTGNPAALVTAVVLSIVEVAVSFDNAIVNASIMKTMSPFWKKMFVTVGMLFAVGFMRLYFPIQIVSAIGGISLHEAGHLALAEPDRFSHILIESHHIVAGFGGAFLMLVALKYFINAEKDVHWVHAIEAPLASLGKLDEVQVLIVAVVSYILSRYLGDHGTEFFYAALIGIGTHIVVDLIKETLSHIDTFLAKGADVAVKGGLGAFIYLEVLDASFSFDGVIAAFAITNQIAVVAAGLGIGAMFVRSLTLMLDDKDTLTTFRYLESGAFWAIGGLAAFMYISTLVHVSEWIIAGFSAVVILVSFLHSIKANKDEELLQPVLEIH
ncbi:DUF475 domain-containing protein [Rhizobium phage RHph_TM39]|uniref:DUF475 domain-containing protein n=1 Tax=Rhizobium phage RHph_TM30 TaxID=2509764 RepID=A0A7S5R5A1_9CAUD|nr:membrane protein [Rhizobium phage RHph_TM30]QIG71701.1 DUF475 domain-containing protein [Rhizobium phage RHph_TM40]QIG72064.1 DUF475 domain-containing protein [Rhizobium phage RHph_TM2_3B]QIG72426.1 DUF475 domain-containing protein [Rhizobium phage RHph_TM3_3_6]QIG77204.1 DUF475 domain-containing protein [Rhizobium phage RHph_TM39]QIG77517.1 DUF475 domain-containing protein [Rhizobium phage RHph_TM21B]